MKILLLVIAGILAIFIVASIIYIATKGKIFKFFYHDLLGWHIPNDELGYNGCSFISTCKICGKEILQDSQGNWF